MTAETDPYLAEHDVNDLTPEMTDVLSLLGKMSVAQQVTVGGIILRVLTDHMGRTSAAHGFHDAPGMAPGEGIDRRLLLAVSEVTEAQEAIRDGHAPGEVWFREKDGKPEGFVMELADVIIRILDLAYVEGVDVGLAVAQKWAFNCSRPALHGRQF